jgi:hypothetical protein
MSGMSHETLAMLLWLMLGLSIALTIAGVAARASGALFLAAFLSFVFGILAFLSIGMFILALALAQLVIGIGIRRQPA